MWKLCLWIAKNYISYDSESKKDENGTPNGKQVLTVHVWDSEENIVPPAEISSRLNLRESEDFLVKYKIAGILTETTIEKEDLTIFYIIIGVLALLLVVAICVSVIIVCMIKRKFDRKQRAAEVLNEVNAGKIFHTAGDYSCSWEDPEV